MFPILKYRLVNIHTARAVPDWQWLGEDWRQCRRLPVRDYFLSGFCEVEWFAGGMDRPDCAARRIAGCLLSINFRALLFPGCLWGNTLAKRIAAWLEVTGRVKKREGEWYFGIIAKQHPDREKRYSS